MTDWLSFVRFDVLFAIIVITIIITSALRNQRKTSRNLVCLIFSLAIVGVPLIFDYANCFTTAVTFANTKVFPIVDSFVISSNPLLLHKLLLAIAIFVAVFVVEGIILFFCRIIGGSDKHKYRKYPAYATLHRPIGGIIIGIFKSAIVVYIMYIVLVFLGDYLSLDLSKEYVVKVIQMFDPIVEKIKAVFDAVLGV